MSEDLSRVLRQLRRVAPNARSVERFTGCDATTALIRQAGELGATRREICDASGWVLDGNRVAVALRFHVSDAWASESEEPDVADAGLFDD